MYQDACKGLAKENCFDGQKKNFQDFVKLIEKEFKKTRVMEALEISTSWDSTASDTEAKKQPTTDGIIDSFRSKQLTQDQVRAHSELVWSDTAYGLDTPKYFKRFSSLSISSNDLVEARNHRRLKHVMMGNKIWNSLTASFQIDIMGGKHEYERNDEFDGPLLWDYIRRRVNPSTTVGASRLKDDIETKQLSDFDHDVIKYNTWFCDTREEILKEEGEGFSEYLRSLFRAYQTSHNQDFLDAIAEEKRKWMQGRLGPDYSYLELMELGRLSFNNLVDDGAWSKTKKKVESEKEQHFLALATEILQQAQSAQGHTSTNKDRQGRERTYQKWRYENPNNEKTKVVDGTTMTWCSNDCHKQPMWCGRSNCIPKAEYANLMKTKRDKGEDKKQKKAPLDVNNEFKIALAALTTAEDYALLDKQFFQSKD